MKSRVALLRTYSERARQTRFMADFYTAIGIVGFALSMLGLIWVLDRV